MIVAAAIKHNGVVFTGVRHCEIFKQILRIFPKTKTPISSPQGFIDNKNNFLNREESLNHAVKCSQIESHNHIIGGVLTSEDLW